MAQPFASCSNCRFTWQTRADFMADRGLTVIGYQVNFSCLTAGFFLFNHVCRGTFAVGVQDFADLYQGEMYQDRATGTDQCPGYCLQLGNLQPCPARCECAFVREIIQILQRAER